MCSSGKVERFREESVINIVLDFQIFRFLSIFGGIYNVLYFTKHGSKSTSPHWSILLFFQIEPEKKQDKKFN